MKLENIEKVDGLFSKYKRVMLAQNTIADMQDMYHLDKEEGGSRLKDIFTRLEAEHVHAGLVEKIKLLILTELAEQKEHLHRQIEKL